MRNIFTAEPKPRSKGIPDDAVGLEYFYKIMEQINRTHDLNLIGREVVEIMVEALGCIGGALFIIDDEHNCLRAFDYSSHVAPGIKLLPKPFRDYYFSLDQLDSLTVQSVLQKKMLLGARTEDFWMPVLSRFMSKAIQRTVGLKTFVSSPAIIAGKVVGVVMVGFKEKEITEQKKRLIELFSDVCAVAINNAQKYQSLNDQYQKMQEILQQQSDFIAVTAHEFRTPLSIATFLLEDILHSKTKPKDYKEELKVVESSLENLKELTEKLFAVQQYDLNKVSLKLKRTAMVHFIKTIYREFQPIVKGKKQKLTLQLSFNHEAYATVDQVQLRQVLHNLLKNASKFSDQGGVICLIVKQEKNQLIICVEDNGPGIPAHLKKSIFEKFRTNSSEGGIGLGLYLCKKIVELHKGKIWAEDAKKKGAIFYIQLPLSK